MSKLVLKGKIETYYYSKDPQFALVHRFGNGVIGASEGWTGCRETLINNIHKRAFQGNPIHRMNRIRFEVLIAFLVNTKLNVDSQKAALKQYVKRSEKIINHFEKRVGWPLTKVKEVQSAQRNTLVYMLSASPRWMRNSFLVSTYLLMFRAGKAPHVGKWKSHAALLEKLKTYPSGKDGSAIRKTSDKWEILLKYRDKLNGDRTVKDNFSVKKVADHEHAYAIGVEGISRLCAGSTADWLYLNRFAKICAKKNIHIPVPKKKLNAKA